MQKWLITMLTMYLMVLLSIPCSDTSDKCDDNITNHELIKNHEHNTNKDDNCSLFCYCNCCNISITNFYFKTIEIKNTKTTFLNRKIFFTNYNTVSSYYGNIWNPPKITI